MACPFEAETSIGPSVDACRNRFDFTQFFEELFFQLIPSCVFVVLAAARIVVLCRDSIKVAFGSLHVALMIYSALQLAVLVKACMNSSGRTAISIPSATLLLIASLALAALSHFEHTRSYRPSFLIGIYLVITLLLRAAVVRTNWLLEGNGVMPSLTLAALLSHILILLLEHCSKRKWFLAGIHKVSVEETAGFLSRSLFAWLNRLMLAGYRRSLVAEDLGLVDGCLASAKTASQFSPLRTSRTCIAHPQPPAPTALKTKSKTNVYPDGRLGLIGMSFRCLGLYALSPALPRLCLTGLTFAQPFLASSLTSYLGSSELPSVNAGYGLIGASFLVYGGIAVSTAWYWHLSFKCATRIRGGLVEVIADKMLRLKPEKEVESKILTLMISDVHRIISALVFIHEFWIAPIETSIGIWLLWNQVGVSSLAVLAVASASTIGSVYIGKNIGVQSATWLTATEKRIAASKRMLSSMKAIKMTCASQMVATGIKRLRVLEFAASKMHRLLLAGSVLSSYSTATLTPVVVFGAYIGATTSEDANFDASQIFSSLILITLISSPLITLLQVIPSLGTALGCAPRIEQFLRRDETVDTRDLGLERVEEKDERDRCDTRSIISIWGADLGWDDDCGPLLKNVLRGLMSFLNMATLEEMLTNLITSWTSLETSLGAIARIENFEIDTPLEKVIENTVEVPVGWPNSGILTFENVWTSYRPERDKPIWSLQDASMNIHPGEKIAVCGRSGYGKSTLLLAILGLVETPKGRIVFDGVDISRVPREILRYNYLVLPQDSFLHGETVREVLDAEGQISDEVIHDVLRECAILDRINAGGGLLAELSTANLSAGERQLLAMTRTVLRASATNSSVVLLDEAMSSVDTATEERIMRVVFEKLQGKTIISVLHRLEAALGYDRILVLEKGQIVHFAPLVEVVKHSELFSSLRGTM